MSVEANTYEELHIQNVNDKTAAICGVVGEYLIANWGINSLEMTVDGKQYEAEEGILEGSELHCICKNLGSAKQVQLALRACGAFSAGWRMDNSFMKYFTDDDEIKANVTYRCIEYYDTDPEIQMYRYNGNELQCMNYTDSAESVADIDLWYCYNPVVTISAEEQMENEELHDQLIVLLNKLCEVLRSDEKDIGSLIEDDWESYGEITIYGGAIFKTEDIPVIIELGKELATHIGKFENAELSFQLYAVPAGEDDYNFASVAIELNGDVVTDSYCRF